MDRIAYIEQEIEGLRKELTDHRVYGLLSEMDDIRIFMQKHVYPVWDFMSLLKALQNRLTCTSLPWKPTNNAKTARFINEIVLGEETDINENGVPKSHFEMYLDAMGEVNADTSKVLGFIASLDDLSDLGEKINHAPLQAAEKEFLHFTFATIHEDQIHKTAAAFTFGREDLIPDMFLKIIEQSSEKHKKSFPKLTYYLRRHIELDGDEHGPLSLEMVKELCGQSEKKWQEAGDTAKKALLCRIKLWDEIADEIEKRKPCKRYRR
ncbi:DUF3050 domain-containing protein [Pseudozobellia thermophila]|uniref:DUF3050 domain-containing protein n=1 Tax=Pseudozobellia thermophila TaxID=192903 RepID=A0A1M6LZK7_9FLAO|nr:DUF3050 domain-containing protein [Pseudozobellia thermophila]SHJ76679.1 Protein of unknown function [Pseudozobellia thermophila]